MGRWVSYRGEHGRLVPSFPRSLIPSFWTLILGSDGTFDLKVQVTFKGNPSELTDYGTYSTSGASVEFHSQKSSPRLSTGTISGNKITANSQFGGIAFEIDVER